MKRVIYLLIILALILSGSSLSSYGMTDQSEVGQQSQKKVTTATKKVTKPRKKRRVRRKRSRRRVRARAPQKMAVQKVAVKADNRTQTNSNAQTDSKQQENKKPRIDNYLLLEYYQMKAEYNQQPMISDSGLVRIEPQEIVTPVETPVVTPVETPVVTSVETPVETPVVTPVETPVVTPVRVKKAPIEMKRMRNLEQNPTSMKTTPVENKKSMETPSSKEKSDDGLPVIMFAVNSNLVPQNQMDKMAELANYLRNHPRTKLCIKGKAPRVNAVRKSLIGRYGILSDRLTIVNDANATAVTFVEK